MKIYMGIPSLVRLASELPNRQCHRMAPSLASAPHPANRRTIQCYIEWRLESIEKHLNKIKKTWNNVIICLRIRTYIVFMLDGSIRETNVLWIGWRHDAHVGIFIEEPKRIANRCLEGWFHGKIGGRLTSENPKEYKRRKNVKSKVM